MPLSKDEGPLGLVMCPSRELATQTKEVIEGYTAALREVRGLGCIESLACMQVFVWLVFHGAAVASCAKALSSPSVAVCGICRCFSYKRAYLLIHVI